MFQIWAPIDILNMLLYHGDLWLLSGLDAQHGCLYWDEIYGRLRSRRLHCHQLRPPCRILRGQLQRDSNCAVPHPNKHQPCDASGCFVRLTRL